MGLWFGNIQQGGEAPATGWDLQFDTYSDGVTSDTTSSTQWSRTVDTTGTGFYSYVNSGRYELVRNRTVLTTQEIDISAWGDVRIDIGAAMSGGQESADYFKCYYNLNGGGWVLYNQKTGLPTAQEWVASKTGLNGNTLVIKFEAYNSYTNEFTWCDYITVSQE